MGKVVLLKRRYSLRRIDLIFRLLSKRMTLIDSETAAAREDSCIRWLLPAV
jgi:hypothetical protein